MDIQKISQIQMRFFGNLEGIYGIKTGFTNGANRCLVTACKRNDMDIICVVLGADTKNYRTKDSIKLIEYTFKNFKPVNIKELVDGELNIWKEKNLNKININKGMYDSIKITISPLNNDVIPIENDLINTLQIKINCNLNLEAPINKSSQIGKIEIFLNNDLLDTINIEIENDIPKKGINYYIKYFLENYCDIITSIVKEN